MNINPFCNEGGEGDNNYSIEILSLKDFIKSLYIFPMQNYFLTHTHEIQPVQKGINK